MNYFYLKKKVNNIFLNNKLLNYLNKVQIYPNLNNINLHNNYINYNKNMNNKYKKNLNNKYNKNINNINNNNPFNIYNNNNIIKLRKKRVLLIFPPVLLNNLNTYPYSLTSSS